MFNKKKNQNMVSTELNLVNIKCNQYNYLKKILFDEKMNLIIQNLQHLDVDLDSFNDFISIVLNKALSFTFSYSSLLLFKI